MTTENSSSFSTVTGYDFDFAQFLPASIELSSARVLEKSRVPWATLAVLQSLMAAGAVHAEGADLAMLGDDDKASALPQMTVEEKEAKALSSPKFTGLLRDTPQTIVVVPREVFQQQSAATLSDVLRNTPGITFAAGEGGSVAAGDSFYMRGFDTSGSLFIDGVRDLGAYSRDVYNLEQVEIAKGPAGADSGRGGSSGYVNLVSKTPKADPFRTAEVRYGTADQQRASIDLNEPLENVGLKGAAVRLNALWQDSGVPGRDEVYNKSWGFSPSLALGLGTPTRLVVAGTYNRQDNLPDSGLPIVALPGGIVTTPPTGSVNQDNEYGISNQDYDHIRNDSILARVEHDLVGGGTISNQTRFGETKRDSITTYVQNSTLTSYDPATGTLFPRRIHNQSYNEILSNQTNLNGKITLGSLENSYSGGAEFSREEQKTPTWVAVTGPATSIYAPDHTRPVTPDQVPSRSNGAYADGKTYSASLYAFDTVKISAKWLFNASLRWDHYKTDYLSVPATGPSLALSTADNLFSYKGGLVFKPVKEGSLYIAYGNSYTPPGTSLALSGTVNSADNPVFKPQESRNYELGVKWEFLKDRLSTSLAFYRSENFNVVTQDSTTLFYTQDAGQRIDGVELGVSGKISEQWLVFGGFAYMKSTYQSPLTSTGGANDGAGLRFTPKASGNLWTTYSLKHGITIGGGVQYSDSVVRSTANGVAATSTALPNVPSYWVVQAMAAYAVNQHLTIRLNVNNIFDETYFRLNNNGGRYYPGVPRSYLVSADLKF